MLNRGFEHHWLAQGIADEAEEVGALDRLYGVTGDSSCAASRRLSGRLSEVSMTIGTPGCKARIRGIASKPSPSGSCRSRITRE